MTDRERKRLSKRMRDAHALLREVTGTKPPTKRERELRKLRNRRYRENLRRMIATRWEPISPTGQREEGSSMKKRRGRPPLWNPPQKYPGVTSQSTTKTTTAPEYSNFGRAAEEGEPDHAARQS